jgi:hypothetical protein
MIFDKIFRGEFEKKFKGVRKFMLEMLVFFVLAFAIDLAYEILLRMNALEGMKHFQSFLSSCAAYGLMQFPLRVAEYRAKKKKAKELT